MQSNFQHSVPSWEPPTYIFPLPPIYCQVILWDNLFKEPSTLPNQTPRSGRHQASDHISAHKLSCNPNDPYCTYCNIAGLITFRSFRYKPLEARNVHARDPPGNLCKKYLRPALVKAFPSPVALYPALATAYPTHTNLPVPKLHPPPLHRPSRGREIHTLPLGILQPPV